MLKVKNELVLSFTDECGGFFQSHSIISLRHLFLNHDVHQLLTPIKTPLLLSKEHTP